MKKLFILLTLAGTSYLSASIPTSETIEKQIIINELIKQDLLVQTKVCPNNVSRMGRSGREARTARMSREVRDTRIERTMRTVQVVKCTKKKYLSRIIK